MAESFVYFGCYRACNKIFKLYSIEDKINIVQTFFFIQAFIRRFKFNFGVFDESQKIMYDKNGLYLKFSQLEILSVESRDVSQVCGFIHFALCCI